MRLFVAIDLSKKAIQEVERVQNVIVNRNVEGSKVKDFHLTLKFLGEVKDDNVPKIVEALKQVKIIPFKIKLDRLGVFPNTTLVRVIWIGLEERRELRYLHEDIRNALPEFVDEHKFHPHLTLARVKFIKDKIGFGDKLDRTEVEPVESDIKSFTLYKSTLTPKGPVYEKIHEFSA